MSADVLRAANEGKDLTKEHPAFTTLLTRLDDKATSPRTLALEWLDAPSPRLTPRELMAACALSGPKVDSWRRLAGIQSCAAVAVERENEKRNFLKAAHASKDADEADAMRMSCVALFRTSAVKLPAREEVEEDAEESAFAVSAVRDLIASLRLLGWGNDHEEIRETAVKLAGFVWEPYMSRKCPWDDASRAATLAILSELETTLPNSATRFELIRRVGKHRVTRERELDPWDTDSASAWEDTDDSTESLPRKGARGGLEPSEEDVEPLEVSDVVSGAIAWALATRSGAQRGEVLESPGLSSYGRLIWLGPHVKTLMAKADELPVSSRRGTELFAVMTADPLRVPESHLSRPDSDLLEDVAEVCFYALRGASQNCSIPERDALSRFIDSIEPVSFRADVCVQFLTWVENDSPRAYVLDRLRRVASSESRAIRDVCARAALADVDRAVRGEVSAYECCLAALSTLKVVLLSMTPEQRAAVTWRNPAMDAVSAALRQAVDVEESVDPEAEFSMRPSMDALLDQDKSSAPPSRLSASAGNIALGRSRLIASAAREVLAAFG